MRRLLQLSLIQHLCTGTKPRQGNIARAHRVSRKHAHFFKNSKKRFRVGVRQKDATVIFTGGCCRTDQSEDVQCELTLIWRDIYYMCVYMFLTRQDMT